MSELAKAWFEESKYLKHDEAIFIRVANKKEQNELARELESLREAFSVINQKHASQLFINKTLKNMKQYIVIERKYRSPYTAFFKNSEGELSKISIDPDRRRQLTLMLKDGCTREEIEEALNGLTEEEISQYLQYFPKT